MSTKRVTPRPAGGRIRLDEYGASYDYWDSVATKYEDQHLMHRIERITRNRPQSGWPILTSNAYQRYGKAESPKIRHFDFRFSILRFFANVWRRGAEKGNGKPPRKGRSDSGEARARLSLRRE